MKQAAIITTLQTTAKDHTLALKEHSTEVDALYNTIKELESRIEGQEQYARRTSLRFHNIKVSLMKGEMSNTLLIQMSLFSMCVMTNVGLKSTYMTLEGHTLLGR